MRYRDTDVAVVVSLPFKRDPLKPLTEDEQWEIELLTYEISKLYRDLGGELCECGKIGGTCKVCGEESGIR